jgi:2-dehydro-3-deoxyphosphogluconate aldolase/(4S)-4-hydroxy-2-oxoglutarate aldolase
MSKKTIIISRILNSGVIAVVRAENQEKAEKIAHACMAGGISAIEITFTVPGAEKIIKKLNEDFSEDEIILGAGTVLNKETAELAIDNGAKYIVSPGFDLLSAKLCNKLDVPYFPGCMTITEMMNARKVGVEVIKLFPGGVFGPGFVKAVRGPLPDIKIIPTGGVSIENVEAWIESGSVAVGVGSELTAPAKTGDYEGVTKLAKEFVRRVKKARERL